ncbi:putative MscS family protein [Neolecta irregularis DAH-3]|uniref:Putative MscS family protein n=1 Tax=Neolecta irregularis (strain DAH-3) TaxID=1198029 RepID=A0A1U7LNW6_NEOID|nr:putative MscS family protein [Neolecta irregularis DAH-3]|eukprot:OLL24283.1 putative MscS family protein [Neolecta irregularis DAH-3]
MEPYLSQINIGLLSCPLPLCFKFLFVSMLIYILMALAAHLYSSYLKEQRFGERKTKNNLQIAILTRMLDHLLQTKPELLTSDPYLVSARQPISDTIGSIIAAITCQKYCHSQAAPQLVYNLLDSRGGARKLARILFTGYRGYIRQFHLQEIGGIYLIEEHMLETCFPDDDERQRVFENLKMGSDDFVSESALENYCETVYKDRLDIRPDVKMDPVFKKAYTLFTVISHVLIVVEIFSSFTISLFLVIILIGRALTKSEVSMGGSMLSVGHQYFLCNFFYHFFEVGDFIKMEWKNPEPKETTTFSGLSALFPALHKHHAPDNQISAFVRHIGFFNTTFQLLTGEIFTMRTSKVYDSTIFNMQRTAAFCKTYSFQVAFDTQTSQIESVKQQVEAFLSQNFEYYKPMFIFQIEDIHSLMSLELGATVFYDFSPQNEILRIEKENEFLQALHSAMMDCKIRSKLAGFPGYTAEHPLYIKLSKSTRREFISDADSEAEAAASDKCLSSDDLSLLMVGQQGV